MSGNSDVRDALLIGVFFIAYAALVWYGRNRMRLGTDISGTEFARRLQTARITAPRRIAEEMRDGN